MSKPVIFVIGASGSVGTATILALSAYANTFDIRAGVRNPEKAEKLKAIPDVTVVQASMGDSNLVSILADVSTLYIVTPGTENRVELTISTAEYAKQAGVKHVLTIGSQMSDTIAGRQLSEIEAKIPKVGMPYTFIRLPLFTDNFRSLIPSIVEQGVIYSTTDPDKPFISVAVDDIGRASATILVNPAKYSGKAVTIASDIHTYSDVVNAFSNALGKEVKYVRVPYEVQTKAMEEAGVEEWQVKSAIKYSELIDSSSPVVTAYDLKEYSNLTGEQPTDMKACVAKIASEYIYFSHSL